MFGFKILTRVKKWFPRVENNVSYFEFRNEICNILLALKNNVLYELRFLELYSQNEANLVQNNVNFIQNQSFRFLDLPLFLDEILMLRILHQLCKLLFPRSLVALHTTRPKGVHVVGNSCERFVHRDLC